MTISFEDFLDVDIRAGTVTKSEPFEGAHTPALKIWIDFGPDIGLKKSSAQVTDHYDPESLIGMQVCAVVNFPPKQIGSFMSEVLVLGFPDRNDAISLIQPDKPVPNGSRLM